MAGSSITYQGMWRWALALLLCAAGLYVLCLLQPMATGHAAWAWIEAFAEAALVGACADWFAVVALFRRPMRLPIPHTAIIPRNKDRIGEHLANFFCTHFLADRQVLEKLAQLNVPTRLAHWLAQPVNSQRVAVQLSRALQWLLQALRTPEVMAFVQSLAARGLRSIDLSPLAGQILAGMTAERRHQQMLDASIQHLAQWLNHEEVQAKIAEIISRELSALRYIGLDQVAARAATRKIVQAVAHTVSDVERSPEHELRLRFDAFVTRFTERLQHDPALASRIAHWRDATIDSPAVATYVQQLWQQALDAIHADLQRPASHLTTLTTDMVQTIGERLAGDPAVRDWLQGELMRTAPALVTRYREDFRHYIVARIQAWDAQELAVELEHHIGRDLQFIRISGTVVGGLVGVLIHAITLGLR